MSAALCRRTKKSCTTHSSVHRPGILQIAGASPAQSRRRAGVLHSRSLSPEEPPMSAAEFGNFVLSIAVLLGAVHALGYLAEWLKQPRIAGEIVAGILLGPFALRLAAPGAFHEIFA